MNASAHLRGIVIAGGLAALALALGFVTLAMNQTASRAAVHTVLTLKARRAAAEHGSTATAKPKPVKPVDQNFLAARQAGLPVSVAKALAKSPVVVVELTSKQDPVAKLAFGEAQAGAAAAGASFVSVNIDQDGGDAQVLTRLLGELPVAPAALVYARPSTLSITLPGFNDSTTVQQAVANTGLIPTGKETLATGTDWATSASAICMRSYTQIANALATSTNAGTARTRIEPAVTSFLAKLKALKPAAGQAVRVKELNALLAKGFAADYATFAAKAAHNAPAAAAAQARSTRYEGQANAIAQTLGATGCTSENT